MSTLIIGVLFCVYFDLSVGNMEMDAIQRLEKMVKIQELKISAIMSENDKLKKRMSEMSAENVHIKQDVSDLQKQNKRQIQINRELTQKIDNMDKELRTTLLQKNDNGEMRYKASWVNTLHEGERNVTETSINNNALDDPHTANPAISAKHQLSGRGSAEFSSQSRQSRGLLMPGTVSISSNKIAFLP
jgi:hypothetical protein